MKKTVEIFINDIVKYPNITWNSDITVEIDKVNLRNAYSNTFDICNSYYEVDNNRLYLYVIASDNSVVIPEINVKNSNANCIFTLEDLKAFFNKIMHEKHINKEKFKTLEIVFINYAYPMAYSSEDIDIDKYGFYFRKEHEDDNDDRNFVLGYKYIKFENNTIKIVLDNSFWMEPEYS